MRLFSSQSTCIFCCLLTFCIFTSFSIYYSCPFLSFRELNGRINFRKHRTDTDRRKRRQVFLVLHCPGIMSVFNMWLI